MYLIPVKTPLITPKDNLIKIVSNVLAKQKQSLSENDILVITSKIISVTENRIAFLKNQSLTSLVKKEADFIFSQEKYALTYTKGLLIPNSGLDQSNTKPGTAILYPKYPQKSADNIRAGLKKQFNLKNLGIIISDSHCQPLRQGVTGIALAYSGFIGVEDCRGQPDLFGRKLQVTKRNLADSLAAAAVVLMGEGGESVPIVIIRQAPVRFINKKINSRQEMGIPPDQCLFKPLYPKEFTKIRITGKN